MSEVTEQEAPEETKASKKELATAAFHAAVDSGKTRAETVTAMQEAADASAAYVTTLYPILCEVFEKKAAAGTRESKAQTVCFPIFEKHVTPVDENGEAEELADFGVARKAAEEEAIETSGLSKASVVAHFRKFCIMHDIELQPASRGDSAAKTEMIKSMLDDGAARKDIVAALQEKFETTPASAASFYQTALKKHDWHSVGGASREGGSAKRAACWDWFKANLDTDRKTAVAHFATLDVSPVMAGNYWSTFSLAKTLADDLNAPAEAEAA